MKSCLGTGWRFVLGISLFTCLAAIYAAADWPPITPEEQAIKDANKEAAAVLGFSSAVGAYGGVFIPKSYGTSIALTGGPEAALIWFVGFYVSCIAITWWFYARKGAAMPC